MAGRVLLLCWAVEDSVPGRSKAGPLPREKERETGEEMAVGLPYETGADQALGRAGLAVLILELKTLTPITWNNLFCSNSL